MLIYILLAIAALILLFLVVVALQPSDFKITRSAKMGASSATIFPHVNDLRKWSDWSPWEKMDPEQQSTISDPSSGVGASHAWNGKKTGQGKMTISESHPHERIGIKLEFIRPFQANNDVEFTFTPDGNQTLVMWTMTGKHGFMGKLMGLLMNMDKMCGGQFDDGLRDLKQIVESHSGSP